MRGKCNLNLRVYAKGGSVSLLAEYLQWKRRDTFLLSVRGMQVEE